MPTLRSNGIDVYYEVHGEGEPLLLIEGLATDLTQMTPLIEGLSRTFKVVAFDNRGSGRTAKPDQPYSMEMMAEDAAGLLNGRGIRSTAVLGISMGGRIAISLALAHPELVKGLILASTSARANYKRGLHWSISNFLLRIPAVRKIGTKYPQPYAYARQREASRGYDATARLHEVRAPTLILQGKRDKVVPFALAEEVHSEIAGSKLVGVEGGHAFMISRPAELVRLATEFLGQGP